MRDICHALITNTSIRVLELKVSLSFIRKNVQVNNQKIFIQKGNNIHGEGTEYLAKLLRQNSTIKS